MIPHMTIICGQKHPLLVVNSTPKLSWTPQKEGVFDHGTLSCGSTVEGDLIFLKKTYFLISPRLLMASMDVGEHLIYVISPVL